MNEDLKYLVKNTKFPYLWTSQILSQIAINMMNFLLLVKLYERTSSTLAVSLLWVSYSLPVIIIGPIASAFVDYVDRRSILIFTNLFQALVIFFYAIFFKENVFLVYSIAFFYSLLNQFYLPSESASVSYLVKKELLPHASGFFYISQQLSLVFGFASASILKNFLGFNISLFICSLLLFMAFVSVLFLPKMKSKIENEMSLENHIIEFFKSIFSGYEYIRANKNILFTFLTLIFVQVIFSIVIISVPTISENILKFSANLSGIYIVIPAALGSLTGAIYIPKFLRNKWRKKNLIEISFITMSILLFVETVIVYYIPLYFNIIISAVLIFFLGVFFTGIIIPSQTFLQENTHDTYKGRIFGNMWFITTIATIIPVIFYGAITEIIGIRLVLFLISILCLIVYYFSKNRIFKIINNDQTIK